jgi:hypothetical protein
MYTPLVVEASNTTSLIRPTPPLSFVSDDELPFDESSEHPIVNTAADRTSAAPNNNLLFFTRVFLRFTSVDGRLFVFKVSLFLQNFDKARYILSRTGARLNGDVIKEVSLKRYTQFVFHSRLVKRLKNVLNPRFHHRIQGFRLLYERAG